MKIQITLPGGETRDISLPNQYDAHFEKFPQDAAILRAATEINLIPELASQRTILKYVIDKKYYYPTWSKTPEGRYPKSGRAVQRGLERLAELGLLFQSERNYWSSLIDYGQSLKTD